jgi:hypothetical protein
MPSAAFCWRSSFATNFGAFLQVLFLGIWRVTVETSGEDEFGRACESVTGGTELRPLLNHGKIHSKLESHDKVIRTRYGGACFMPGKMLPVASLLGLGISFELKLPLKLRVSLPAAISLILGEFQNETESINEIPCASQTWPECRLMKGDID